MCSVVSKEMGKRKIIGPRTESFGTPFMVSRQLNSSGPSFTAMSGWQEIFQSTSFKMADELIQNRELGWLIYVALQSIAFDTFLLQTNFSLVIWLCTPGLDSLVLIIARQFGFTQFAPNVRNRRTEG